MPKTVKNATSICIALLGCLALQAQPTIWTQHNGNSRTGSNTMETALKPSSVNVRQFGKLFSYTLDDQTYSQPLYIPGLTMEFDGKTHNVVFVTTVNNTVYAWDADNYDANGGHPLGKQKLTPENARVPNANDMSEAGACGGNYHDFAGNLGMVGTPVVDVNSKTLYVVSHIIEEHGKHVQRLHALDLTSGKERLNPREIQAKINTKFGDVEFSPKYNNQRPALALAGSVVYIGWASYCDSGDYHGWIMGYKASDLSQLTAWSTTTTGEKGGFWQSGQGVMVDDKANLFVVTGNGTSNEEGNYSESVVKLSPNPQGALQVASFFTPINWVFLNDKDLDFGSAGVIPIPGTTLIAGGGKEGMFYLIDGSGRQQHESAANPASYSARKGSQRRNARRVSFSFLQRKRRWHCLGAGRICLQCQPTRRAGHTLRLRRCRVPGQKRADGTIERTLEQQRVSSPRRRRLFRQIHLSHHCQRKSLRSRLGPSPIPRTRQ